MLIELDRGIGERMARSISQFHLSFPTLNPTWACCMLFFRSYGDAMDLKNSPRKESA